MPGFGRPPPAPPGRGATGRGIPASLLVKGLLPGRGVAGLAAPASLLVNGLLPGRGPAGRAGASAAGSARAAGAATSAGAAGGSGASATGAGAAGTSGAAGSATTGSAATAFLAVAFLVVFFAGAAAPAGCAGKTSFNLRTTGGSTVDDADLTNSPMSWSLARTTLLSTPSSLASSYTRTLATALLFPRSRPGGADRQYVDMLIAARSSRARRHLVLLSVGLRGTEDSRRARTITALRAAALRARASDPAPH